MKTLILPLVFLSSLTLSAQSKYTGKHIRVIVGYGGHGTGDMTGGGFAAEYEQSFSRFFCWAVGLGATMHNDEYPLYYEFPSGEKRDGSIRHTTAGMQATGFLGYSPLKTSRHEIQLRIGPLVRYQFTSQADITSIEYPALTGRPYPVITFDHRSSPRTIAVGYSAQAMYQFTINRKISIGAVAGFQEDTEGDTISQLSVSVGRRL